MPYDLQGQAIANTSTLTNINPRLLNSFGERKTPWIRRKLAKMDELQILRLLHLVGRHQGQDYLGYECITMSIFGRPAYQVINDKVLEGNMPEAYLREKYTYDALASIFELFEMNKLKPFHLATRAAVGETPPGR